MLLLEELRAWLLMNRSYIVDDVWIFKFLLLGHLRLLLARWLRFYRFHFDLAIYGFKWSIFGLWQSHVLIVSIVDRANTVIKRLSAY